MQTDGQTVYEKMTGTHSQTETHSQTGAMSAGHSRPGSWALASSFGSTCTVCTSKLLLLIIVKRGLS